MAEITPSTCVISRGRLNHSLTGAKLNTVLHGKKQIISNHRINQIITYYNPLTIQSCDYTPAHTIIQREDDARM